MTPDVDVVRAASRSDHPHHKQALSWLRGAWEDCRTGGSFQLLPMVAAAFLRLATRQQTKARLGNGINHPSSERAVGSRRSTSGLQISRCLNSG